MCGDTDGLEGLMSHFRAMCLGEKCTWLNIVMCFGILRKKFYFQKDLEKNKYEGWNFNSGNYLFTTDTK